MAENWKEIPDFPGYSVSDWGRVRSDRSGRILALNENQSGLVYVGLVQDGIQYHRSVPLMVSNAFIFRPFGPFDTPINLDGDRFNNHVDNLAWRPRWFAIKYHMQFKWVPEHPIEEPIIDIKTNVICENSFECAITYGLLEHELIDSIYNNTYVWPTYQQFRILAE
jgi:hypothetical protein